MQKVLVSLPDDLAVRMKRMIPPKQRSRIIAEMLEAEIAKREHSLYQCACEVEADSALNNEMKDWEATVGDGIEPESW
jgi:metal-responsive CopG/Arc/MetJ family transcriptional regulator